MKFQLPVISYYPPFAEAGALFSFGVDDAKRFKRLAYFVDRILKGAKPAELPVEQRPRSSRWSIRRPRRRWAGASRRPF
jgi:ABC-type uncharacterized transport system substrate-binding protein